MMPAVMQRVGTEVRAVLRAETATHRHLRERVSGILTLTFALDAVAAVIVYFLERDKSPNGIHTFGDAVFWTTAQLLTVSSQMPNPISSGGKIVDLVLELWAITAVTALGGSFGAFFHRRGMERDPMKPAAQKTRPVS
jgi:hypothetical protein